MNDCRKLVIGNDPANDTSFPLSSRYAKLLAELAQQRGFDGYLLNFESDLYGGSVQARTLVAWLSVLDAELRDKVGNHAEVIW